MNHRGTSGEMPSGRRIALAAFFGGLAVAVSLQLLLAADSAWLGATGEFLGPDSYMRLSRVLECRGGFGCLDGLYPRANAPFGDVLHWPWMMDWLLLLVALPLTPFIGFPSAVSASGYLLSPLLEIVAIGLLILGARSLLTRGLPFVGILAASQLWFVFAFFSVRPDHHGLQLAIFAGFLAFLIRTLLRPDERSSANAAGVFAGLAIWASTEALITLPPLFAVLAGFWLVRGGSEAAVINRRLMLSATATLCMALLFDGPQPDRWSPDFDRFSVVHLTLFGLLTALWFGLERVRAQSAYRRFGVSAFLLALIAGIMVSLYPGVHGGPMAGLPPELWTLWLDHTAEFLPLLGEDQPRLATVSMVRLLLALPVAGYLMVRGPKRHRWVWALFVITLIWFGILASIVQMRWSYYLHVLYPIPLSWALGALIHRFNSLSVRSLRPALIAVSIFVFTFGPAAGTAFAFRGEDPGEDPTLECRARDILPVLQSLSRGEDSTGIILSQIFWGPEILYRSELDVVATPYHRNASGIMDSHRIMATPPSSAFDLIDRRGIQWIAVCIGQDWLPLVGAHEEGTFYQVLQQGGALDRLHPVPLPETLVGKYRLWEVEPKAGPN